MVKMRSDRCGLREARPDDNAPSLLPGGDAPKASDTCPAPQSRSRPHPDRIRFPHIFGCLLIAGILVAQSAVGQDSTRIHRIGFINTGPLAPNASNVEAFRAGLRDLGYIEGRNIIIDYRWADQKIERLPGLMNELLALKAEVIVSTGGQHTIAAAKAATSTVPVVFITGDPVAEKVVPSLSRPGGNLTGFAVLAEDLEAKRLELLKEAFPKAERIAVIWNPDSRMAGAATRDVEAAAVRLKIAVQSWQARDARELEPVLASIAAAKVDALMVLADPVLGFERARIVEFATKNRLPGIYFWREFAEIGGLMSYGTSLSAVYRRTAAYVDKILKGAKPGDLPVEQPTTFELVINLKTAKAFGVTIPRSLLARANEVIE